MFIVSSQRQIKILSHIQRNLYGIQAVIVAYGLEFIVERRTGQVIEHDLSCLSFILIVSLFNSPLSKDLICFIIISLGRTFNLNLVSFFSLTPLYL